MARENTWKNSIVSAWGETVSHWGWSTVSDQATSLDKTEATTHPEKSGDWIAQEFFHWLLQTKSSERTACAEASEWRKVERLDQWINSSSSQDRLMPYSASVVPKLLARLRQDGHSSTELAQQVQHDMALATDVMRMANSVYYRRSSQVLTLNSAILMIGDDGLRSVIARAMIKPIFTASGNGLVTRSAQRLWGHVENKAQRCAVMAKGEGLDPFMAYLAGLVHDAAWVATFRGLDKIHDDGAPWCFDSALIDALLQRRDRLFGLLAVRWQLEADLIEAANEVSKRGLRNAQLPLARILCSADEMSSRLALSLFGKNVNPIKAN